MKRTHYLASIVVLLAGLYGLSSCTAVQEDAPQGLFTEEVSFVVNLDEMPVTKTVNNGNSTVWGEEDRITIINHDINSEDDDFRSGYLTHRGNNEFGGRIGALSGDMFNWYFVYPYRSDNKSPREISISVESNPTQDGNGDNKMAHLAGEGFPLYGKVTNSPKNANIPAIYMVQVLSRLDYKVTNATSNPIVVKEVEFSAPAAICGDFTGDLTVDTPAWTAESDASKVLKLSVENGKEIAAGGMEEYFAGFVPFKLEAGKAMQVKITAVNPSNPNSNLVYYKVYKFDSDVTFRAGQFNSFNLSFDPANSDTPVSDEPVNPDPSGDLEDQILTFNNANVTWTLGSGYSVGSSYAAQSVSGAQTTVTYTSSNTNVATVSGNYLVIVGAGTTIITANAASNNQYNAASLSYTLNITQSGTTPTSDQRTYTYQSSVSAGTYLIGGYESSGSQYSVALFPTVINGNWESSQGTVTNGQYIAQRDIDSSTTLTYTNDSEIFNAEVELIASGSNWKIKVKSTGQYLVVPTADNRIVYTDSESSATAFSISGSGSGSTWGGSTSGNGMGVSSGSYYFYHSSSAHGFSMRAYQVTNIRLYKLTSEGGSSSSQSQPLSFNQSSVSLSMNSYPAGSTYTGQSVNGAVGSVTYTSSNTNVARISGNGSSPTFTIVGAGTTTITANAVASGNYSATSLGYTLTVTSSSSTPSTGDATYVKATSLTVGGTYLITSVDDTKLFKGASDGSYVTINASNGVITDSNNAYSGYEFTITQSGSKYCLIFNDGKYLLCDYTNGNNTTGLTFESSKPSDSYLYSYTVNNGVFEFMTAQRNSSSTSEVLYYKPSSMGGTGADTFKIGGSGVGVGVHIYMKTSSGSGKKTQSPYFSSSTVSQSMETASGTMTVQTLQNAVGNVSYTSSTPSVATIDGTTITIKGFGSTTITGTAAGNDEYYAGSATYTLTINRLNQEGVFNLENSAVMDFIDAALSQYTASNRSTSIVGNYAKNVGENNRLDWPSPVTVTWSSVLSGDKSVYIYSDAAHTQQIDYIKNPQTVSSTTNTLDVYNLIPGRTYYYVVRSGNSDVASGEFTTEGRRRMIRMGSQYGQNFANNCRDFGGQTTTNGKRIKYGKLFRGTNIDGTNTNSSSGGYGYGNGFGNATGPLNEEAEANLFDYLKIRLDVDLRGSGSGYGTYMNNNHKDRLSDITAGDVNTWQGHTQETYASQSDLTSTNKQYDGNTKTKMGVTLTRIMKAAINNTNVYIHCMVGADRTGFTCMMIESVLGVPLERCDIDYEMTSFSGVGPRNRSGSNGVSHYSDGVNAIQGRLTNSSSATYQDKAIDYIVNVHGVDRDLITQFQNVMLE